MDDFRALRILDTFKALFIKLGIDYPVMRRILQVKLTLDERRVPSIFNGEVKKEGSIYLKTLALYAFYGLILIPFIILGENYMFQMSLVFGVILFILMTTMISDFSTVLLDLRDKSILNTKPISRKTINAAKIIHVIIYMSFITSAFVAIPFAVGLFTKGIGFALIFLVEIIIVNVFVVVLTAILYLLVLRFFDGERLKDIINYVQILLSVGIVIGYQILLRSFDLATINVEYVFSWWHLFIPALWYGAPFEMLLHQQFSTPMIVFSSLAICVPLISFYLYSRVMPSFERNLQKLMTETGSNKKKWAGMDSFFSKIMCRRKEEQIFYRFASKMMTQEREFKLRVYPALGLSILLPALFVFNDLRMYSLSEVSNSKTYFALYFCNLMIPGVIHMLKFSGTYKGSWIYRSTPIQYISSIYSATLKAFFVKLYIPIFLINSVIFIWVFSPRIIPEIVIILLVAVVQIILTYRMINNEDYPFSQSYEFAQEQQTANNLLLFLITGLFVVGHFIALSIPLGIYIYMVILLVIIVVGWRVTFPKK